MAFIEVDEPAMLDSTGQDIVTAINNLGGAISPSARNVSFDNTGTDLTSSDVERAIKEVNGKIGKRLAIALGNNTGSISLSALSQGFNYNDYNYCVLYCLYIDKYYTSVFDTASIEYAHQFFVTNNIYLNYKGSLASNTFNIQTKAGFTDIILFFYR